MAIVAGVDSSTQSTTVVLMDSESAAVVGMGSSPHPPTFPPLSEQDPGDWWDALRTALGRARDEADVRPQDIRAISIAAQCHGLVALDAHGTVIRPVKLWNDTTSSVQAKRLGSAFSIGEWVRRVGSLPPPAFTITKLAWLAENEPANFERLALVLLPHDWLTWRLCGVAVTDRSEASGTGYYSASRDQYDEEILGLVDPDRDWRGMLPTVLGPNEQAGVVSDDVAADLGLCRGAVVGPGSGDQHAGAIGLGAECGDIVFVLGTSGVVYGLSAEELLDPSGAINCVADAAGGYQPLVCKLNAAKVTDTFARLLGVDHAELSRLAMAADRRPDRPVLAAFLDGERTPDRPRARGALAGLTSAVSREDLALAAFEGVVLGLVDGFDALTTLGVAHDRRVLVTGGGAGSTAYRQVLADTLGREVLLPRRTQPVAVGAATQAAAVLRGTQIQELRSTWAPPTALGACPRLGGSVRTVRDRYEALVAWHGLDS